MPAMIRVIAKTTEVASAAIKNRRRRNCRSRTPTSHTAGVSSPGRTEPLQVQWRRRPGLRFPAIARRANPVRS